jgi:hypothetical protein
MNRGEAIERCIQSMDTFAKDKNMVTRTDYTIKDTGTEVHVYQNMAVKNNEGKIGKVGVKAAYGFIDTFTAVEAGVFIEEK